MDSLLNELLKNGILDETVICKIKAMKDQEYLNMHRYKIYQNKDGRWVTYLPGRKRIQRKDRAELEALIVEYYKKNRYDPTIIDIFKEWNERRVNLGKIKQSTATRFDHDFDKFTDPAKPVEWLAVRREEYLKKMEMIEQAAIEADSDIYEYLVKGVTQGMTYSHLRADGLLCSRDYYYCQYRHFFWCLNDIRR